MTKSSTFDPGKLITSARISSEPSDTPTSWSPEQIQAFGEKIRAEAWRWREMLGIDPDVMAKEAEIYTSQNDRRYPIGPAKEFAALFERGGFHLDRFELVPWTGKVGEQAAGPGTNQAGTYAHVVASRA